jgi:hypothetical protein
MKLQVEFNHGSGLNPYHNTMINSTVKMCRFLNGTENNPLAQWFLDVVSDSFPVSLVHPCPYFGEYKMQNVTFGIASTTAQFLKGSYEIKVRYFDKQDDNIITLNLKTDLV